MRKIFYVFFLLFFTSCNNEENESIAVDVNFQESNLPIVMIDTYGEDILDEPRIDAYMGVINNANGINNIGENFNDYDGKITIENPSFSNSGAESKGVFPPSTMFASNGTFFPKFFMASAICISS